MNRWIKHTGLVTCLCFILAGFYFFQDLFSVKNQEIASNLKPSQVAQLFEIPLYFEKNEGQTDSEVKYLTRGHGYTFYFTPQKIVMVLQKTLKKQQESFSTVLKFQFVNAKQDPLVKGLDEQEFKSHYFIGNDSQEWHPNISTFSKVHYEGLYPGIDAIFYGNHKHFEYDLHIFPGANPQDVRLSIEGAKKLSIHSNGNLCIYTSDDQEVHMQKPFVYQINEGKKETVESSFILLAKGEVGFAVGPYNTNKLLIIDPVLLYSTYLGGSLKDIASGIALDNNGNTYITGNTTSLNFPTMNPFQPVAAGALNAFVTKINSSGSALIYSTYLGGNIADFGNSIAVDSSGNAYIAGRTSSTNFPLNNPLQPIMGGSDDSFITKLNPSGSALVYSTYLGGSGNDAGNGIAVDSNGNAVITGSTFSANFPLANPFQAVYGGNGDGFITKLNPTGTAFVYSTYLGGSNTDIALGIALDNSDNAYIVGSTQSTDFPVFNPLQPNLNGNTNAFITKINPSGSALIYSTYLGGSNDDIASGVVSDASGNAYVIGATSSSDFPTQNPLQSTLNGIFNAFITKIVSDGSSLAYSTYLGGNQITAGNSIAVDSSKSIYVTGSTTSTNFPLKNPLQSTLNGTLNAFITKINSTGTALISSTYFGGSGDDNGASIVVDGNKNVYVAGGTTSTDFPILNALQATYGGGAADCFILKLSSIEFPIVTTVAPPQGPASGGTIVTITGNNFDGTTQVNFGINSAMIISVSSTQIVVVSPPGTGTVDITITTPEGTSLPSITDRYTYILAPTITGLNPTSGPVTGGTSVTISGTGFTGATSVLFGNSSAIFTVNSDTSIIATAPAGVGQVDVTVTGPGGTSTLTNVDLYTYLPVVSLLFPPIHLKGIQKANQFATQTDYVNILTWKAPTQGKTPVAYRIYRDKQLTELIAVISSNERLRFSDHQRKKNKTYTYWIISEDEFGNFSTPAIVKVKGR